MSLVHPSLIAVLNRRFVNTYYNQYEGPGFDEQGFAYSRRIEDQGQSLRYGAIVTPDDELVTSFGYDRAEFVAALRHSLETYPELSVPSEAEHEIMAAAEERPDDVEAQVRAARLEGELLHFEAGRSRLSALLKRHPAPGKSKPHGLAPGDLSPAKRARALYERARLGVLDFDRTDEDAAALRTELDAIEGLPEELEDDRVAVRLSLDIELLSAPGFWAGWGLREGLDPAAFAGVIEPWLERAPRSNRRGELLFYLGLARQAAGDETGADEVWARHVDELPDDRFAMLSRMHHTNYDFSPRGSSKPLGGSVSDPAMVKQMLQLIENGVALQVQASDGSTLSGQEAIAYLESMSPGLAVARRQAVETQPERDNFAHPEGTDVGPHGVLESIVTIGRGPVPLLLIAGLGFDAEETWGMFARRNAERYTSHLVTLPGMGDTRPWPMPARADDFADDTWVQSTERALVAHVAAESLHRPVVAGHFIVANALALRLARNHPDVFRGALVVTDEPSRDVAGRGIAVGTDERRSIVTGHWMPFFRAVAPETWSQGMYPPALYSRDAERAQALWDSTDRVPVPTMVRWFLEYMLTDTQAGLESLRIPLLVLSSDGDQPWSWIKATSGRELPQVRLQTWPAKRAVAFPMLDAPEWFDQAAAEFLETLDG